MKLDHHKTWTELLQAALVQHQQCNYAQAEHLYRQVLDLEPLEQDALRLLGILYRQLSRWEESRSFLESCVKKFPGSAEARHQLGLLYCDLGRLGDAAVCFIQAVKLRPGFADAYYHLGQVYQAAGKIEEAENCFRKAVQAVPEMSEAIMSLGSLLETRGHFSEAEKYFTDLIRLNPDNDLAYLRLALVAEAQGKLAEAEQNARLALKRAPHNSQIHFLIGTLMIRQNQLSDAVLSFNEAVQLDPNLETCAVVTLKELLEDGVQKWQKTLQSDPSNTDALVGLARIYYLEGQPAKAIELCQRILITEPQVAPALFVLALSELLLGRYETGWLHYESRFDTGQREFRRRGFSGPQWKGEEIRGKTLLVHAEQGVGDSIQFARFLPFIVREGGQVIVEVQPSVVQLIKTIPGIEVVAQGDPLPRFDMHVSLLSLPAVFKTRLETVPNHVPYVQVPNDCHFVLPESSTHRLRIGIAWAGNPQLQNDLTRSLALAKLLPICAVPRVSVYSLQVGPASYQLEAVREQFGIIDLKPSCKNFGFTAAAVQQLDLIVSVDTAVAHLAGALGKPVWLLLPFAPEWRWLLDRDDSPWYPTMKLFRQRSAGNWDGIIKMICDQLKSCVAQADRMESASSNKKAAH